MTTLVVSVSVVDTVVLSVVLTAGCDDWVVVELMDDMGWAWAARPGAMISEAATKPAARMRRATNVS